MYSNMFANCPNTNEVFAIRVAEFGCVSVFIWIARGRNSRQKLIICVHVWDFGIVIFWCLVAGPPHLIFFVFSSRSQIRHTISLEQYFSVVHIYILGCTMYIVVHCCQKRYHNSSLIKNNFLYIFYDDDIILRIKLLPYQLINCW